MADNFYCNCVEDEEFCVCCMCPICKRDKEEMVKYGHWVPTKEWGKNKPTGEELEEKIRELY